MTDSNREGVARELNNTIPVYIRGTCARLWDKRLRNISDDGQRHGTALNVEEYYFYLAFENTLCKDYVTEKFFDALAHNIVPVVFGGAQYSDFAPPHSFIDIQEFESVKAAGEYLNYLIEHPEEYVEYFWWKQYYEVRDLSDSPEDRISPAFPCALCEYLHHARGRKVYEDLREWWEGGAGCQGEVRGHYCNRKNQVIFKGRERYRDIMKLQNVSKIVHTQKFL